MSTAIWHNEILNKTKQKTKIEDIESVIYYLN